MKKQELKTSLIKKVKEERAREQEQNELREQYGIDKSKDVVLIPGKSLFETLLDKVVGVIKVTLICVILFAAAIGVLAMMYPETRGILFETFQGWQEELNMYLNL